MASAPFPILFLAPPRRLDALFASGLVQRLHEEIDNARFTVVASPEAAPLFRDVPGLDELIVAERRGFWTAFALWRRLRRRRWGLALDAEGGGLVGFLRTRRRARPTPGPPAPTHKVVQAARLLKLEEDAPAPWLFLSEETRARADELVGEGGPILAMAPGSPWIGSTWPIERFARTAVQLLADNGPLAGGRLLIVGTPADAREADSLRRSAQNGRWIDLTHETDPLVICACLARARLAIGGAAWLTHLAAASGAPTLGLYGPTDESVEGVWGERTRVVRGPRSFESIRAADPRLDQSICHMRDLSVEVVMRAALDLLAKTAPAERKRRHG